VATRRRIVPPCRLGPAGCRKKVLEVGQEKFLVLLFMVQPQDRQPGQFGLRFIGSQQGPHAPIDIGAVVEDGCQ